MDISEVKSCLNKAVTHKDPKLFIDIDYVLTGCILRKNENGFYYQAELQDKNNNSIIIAHLDNVKRKD